MEIVTKFKGKGVKIEKTKSRHEIFSKLINHSIQVDSHWMHMNQDGCIMHKGMGNKTT